MNITYDKEEDIIYITDEGKVKFSLDIKTPISDLYIDYGFDGKIIGIEIFEASKYLKLAKKALESIKNAKVKIAYSRDSSSIEIELKDPLSKKIISKEILTPYNKGIILAH